MDQELLTVDELAARLKVPRSWIYQRTRLRGPDRLPHVKLGKYLRFEEETVRAWLGRQRAPEQNFSDCRPNGE